MVTIQDVSAEQLAKLFHDYRKALSDDGVRHGIKEESAWDRTPPSERKLMVAAARLTLLDLATTSAAGPARKYYAKPGEAEWGC